MSKFWNELLEKAKVGLAFSTEKIEEYSYIGKLKLDIINSKRNTDNLYKKLGKHTFEMINAENSDIANDEIVKDSITKIKDSIQEQKELEDKLENARKDEKTEKSEEVEKTEEIKPE